MRTAFLILLLFASSCSGRKTIPPPDVIAPDRFADLYVDLLKHGVQVLSSATDSLAARRVTDSLLEVHTATRGAVTTSVAWYNQDVVRWRLIMDSVTIRLEREQATATPVQPRG
jgi:hypothetical protein